MTQLLKKDVTHVFSDGCQRALTVLKQKLMESPVLSIYNPASETELYCDASSAGFGATLMQTQPDGKFHLISYFPKTASPAGSRSHS